MMVAPTGSPDCGSCSIYFLYIYLYFIIFIPPPTNPVVLLSIYLLAEHTNILFLVLVFCTFFCFYTPLPLHILLVFWSNWRRRRTHSFFWPPSENARKVNIRFSYSQSDFRNSIFRLFPKRCFHFRAISSSLAASSPPKVLVLVSKQRNEILI
jgi:hypothetical protein